MSTVKISNVQAIQYIEFDMPTGEGGVRIFRGQNGEGKSTAIACINALLGRKVVLNVSDGAPKGKIEGLGVTREIKARAKSVGDPEVASLEGRFDFSDLVDPPVKAPAARTKGRVRALVGLTAGECGPENFYELFGGEERFSKLVSAEAIEGITDPVDLADKIKSQVEQRARHAEAAVEDETARWQIAIENSGGWKPEQAPPPVSELATAYSKAKDAVAAANEQVSRRVEAMEANQETEAKLKQHAAAKPDGTPASHAKVVKEIDGKIAELEAQLAELREERSQAKTKMDDAARWRDRHEELQSMLQEVPDDVENLDALITAESEALEALNNADESKQKHAAAVLAVSLHESITTNTKLAEDLRELAKGTSTVITSLLPESCPLQFRDGSLKYQYTKRDKWVDFDELSEGERWEIGLMVATEAVGEGGVIPVAQEAWQSLDEESKQAVAEQCKAAKVWVVTGQVDEGELRVESY